MVTTAKLNGKSENPYRKKRGMPCKNLWVQANSKGHENKNRRDAWGHSCKSCGFCHSTPQPHESRTLTMHESELDHTDRNNGKDMPLEVSYPAICFLANRVN